MVNFKKPSSFVLDENGTEIAIKRLTKDLREAATILSDREARFLVDRYYLVQKNRIASGNQLKKFEELGSPNSMIMWFHEQENILETTLKNALHAYSKSSKLGRWALSITGIGPVLSAGLLAYLDIRKAPTAGHFWSIAGFNPNLIWYGTEKADQIVNEAFPKGTPITDESLTLFARAHSRNPQTLMVKEINGDSVTYSLPNRTELKAKMAKLPYDQRLKTICWKIGESFVMKKNSEKDHYGHIYMKRKAYEQEMNEKLAWKSLADKSLQIFKKDTISKEYYLQGKLPPAHIDNRARKHAVKIFLSHYHEVAYFLEYNKAPPNPFAIEKLGHAHYIPVPNFEFPYRR